MGVAAIPQELPKRDVHCEECGASWQTWQWVNPKHLGTIPRLVIPKLFMNLRPFCSKISTQIPVLKFAPCAFSCFTVVFFMEFSGQVFQFGIELHGTLV